jgi:hypothetical protein
MENPSPFSAPGGIEVPQIGNPLASGTSIVPTHRMHHIIGTGTIKNISIASLWPDFIGPVILLADAGNLWTWDATGNIAAAISTGAVVAGLAYPFAYDRQLGKWYPLNTVGA